MRMVVRFGKNSRLRFISHLDLQRFFQRALNRSGLPIAFSQGFNPHPVMAFASALALGWTSEYEMLDVKLAVPMGRRRVEESMRGALPDDLPVMEVKLIDDRASSMMPMVRASDYRISGAGISREMLDDFLSRESVMAMRKTKSGEKLVDIRPMALDLRLEDGDLLARLSLTDKDTLKPDLLVRTLTGSDPETMRIHRLALLGDSGEGALEPLMKII
jgi:radical SAM-linked protein